MFSELKKLTWIRIDDGKIDNDMNNALLSVCNISHQVLCNNYNDVFNAVVASIQDENITLIQAATGTVHFNPITENNYIISDSLNISTVNLLCIPPNNHFLDMLIAETSQQIITDDTLARQAMNLIADICLRMNVRYWPECFNRASKLDAAFHFECINAALNNKFPSWRVYHDTEYIDDLPSSKIRSVLKSLVTDRRCEKKKKMLRQNKFSQEFIKTNKMLISAFSSRRAIFYDNIDPSKMFHSAGTNLFVQIKRAECFGNDRTSNKIHISLDSTISLTSKTYPIILWTSENDNELLHCNGKDTRWRIPYLQGCSKIRRMIIHLARLEKYGGFSFVSCHVNSLLGIPRNNAVIISVVCSMEIIKGTSICFSDMIMCAPCASDSIYAQTFYDGAFNAAFKDIEDLENYISNHPMTHVIDQDVLDIKPNVVPVINPISRQTIIPATINNTHDMVDSSLQADPRSSYIFLDD